MVTQRMDLVSNKRINELESLIDKLEDKNKFIYVQALDSIVSEYETLGNSVKAVEYAREIVDMVTNEKCKDRLGHIQGLNAMLLNAYDVLARNGDFRAFCLALEWNRPVDKKYYIPRMDLLERHGILAAFQDLADDKLDLLVLNMPPRLVLVKVQFHCFS